VALTIFALLGLVILGATIGAYVWLGGFVALSHRTTDWANFGSYVGGVAGPMLSFLALVAVVWTLRLQYKLLQRDWERQLADQHVRWLDALYRDMQEVLRAPLALATAATPATSLRAVLDKEMEVSAIESTQLKARLTELMELLGQYSEAVALYRDNVTAFFDLRVFADRGARILDRIKPFHALLGALSPITIEFCDMHLRGDRSRKSPEALARRTRNP
jgi:hypothetical protein